MGDKYLYQDLTEKIIGIAMEVHRTLGPEFLEGVYEEAVVYELEKAGLKCDRQKEFPIRYKEITLKKKLRCDLVVENKMIIENKAASEIAPIDEVQLISYLKASGLQIGLLFNFGNKSLESNVGQQHKPKSRHKTNLCNQFNQRNPPNLR